MNKSDCRWKQRFQNFEKAFLFLKKGLEKKTYDDLQAAGIIQSFEFTFELSWKTMKDYLEDKGLAPQYPRDVLKQAFQNGLVENGQAWIDMLDKRNELSHTYDDDSAQKATVIIKRDYFEVLDQLYSKLKQEAA